MGGEVYRDMRRAEFVEAFQHAVIAHKIVHSSVHNFTKHAFAKFNTVNDRFFCQSCADAWGWESIDDFSTAELTGSSMASRRSLRGPHAIGCCEKSALFDGGMFSHVHGLDNISTCFRDWEVPSSALVKHHRKLPVAE